jgi:hypothetical protein
MHESEPFYPFLNALEHTFEGRHARLTIAAIERHAPNWVSFFPSLAAKGGNTPNGDTEITSGRLLRELTDALRALAAEHTTVVTVEDVQWADPSSLDVLAALPARIADVPLLVLCTLTDPCDSDTAHVHSLIAAAIQHGNGAELRLPPLNAAEVREYLAYAFPESPVVDALASSLYVASGGVPLFANAFIRWMQLTGKLCYTRGRWELSGAAIDFEVAVPQSLQIMIENEIASLPADEQTVLEGASLEGPQFTVWNVSSALGVPSAVVEQTCNQIVRSKGMLRWTGSRPGPDGRLTFEYEFVHSLYREILYVRQTSAERIARHVRLAKALEASLAPSTDADIFRVADHFASGKDYERGVQYLQLAADNASRRGGQAEAISLLRQALYCAKGTLQHDRAKFVASILRRLARIYRRSGEFNRSCLVLRSILRRAIAARQTEAAITALSDLTIPTAWIDIRKAARASSHVLSQLSYLSDPDTRAEATIQVHVVRAIARGWSERDAQNCHQALRQLEQSGNARAVASARILYAWFPLSESDYAVALQAAQESIPHVLAAGATEDVTRAHCVLSWSLIHLGEWGRAVALLESCIVTARDNSNKPLEGLFTSLLAWLHLECGDYIGSTQLCAEAVSLAPELQLGMGGALVETVKGFAALRSQDCELAREHFSTVLGKATGGRLFWHVVAHMGLTESWLANSDLVRAAHTAHHLDRCAARMRERTWQARALSTCARVAMASEDWIAAENHLTRAFDAIRVVQAPLAEWRLHGTAGELAQLQARPHVRSEYQKSGTIIQQLQNSLNRDSALSTTFRNSREVTSVMTALAKLNQNTRTA